MKPFRHLLRDVVIFSLPLLAVVIFLSFAAAASFFRAEIGSFHGYPVRGLRAGGLITALRQSLAPLGSAPSRRYRADGARRAGAPAPVRQLDLHVDGTVLDRLEQALPGSGREWQPASLVEGNRWLPVEVHYRGQQMSNFFWRIKAWKIRTPRRSLVDGYRVINLTPLEDRLESHLTFMSAELAGLPSPRSRVVQLYLNLKDQGPYLQEEQIDESMIRRIGRMPGDIFYGELLYPAEPKMSSDDLFWNPYLWRKKDRNNLYPEEYRPYLAELLDHVADDSPASFDRLYELVDVDQFALYLAVISFQGDLHIDHSHNHRLYFNPLSGKFEGILWNSRLTMPPGNGVESMANRFFRKLARDPRFLDRVQRNVYERLHLNGATQLQTDELDAIRRTYPDLALEREDFTRSVETLRAKVVERGRTVQHSLEAGEATFQVDELRAVKRLLIFAKAAASLRLTGVRFTQPATGIRVLEDRDFDGQVSAADRELAAVAEQGARLAISADGALLFVGRDFRAPYHQESDPGKETYQVMRDYTRLAYLASPLLLVSSSGEPVPRIAGIEVERSIGKGPVTTRRGPPDGYVATETIHPWRIPSPPSTKHHRFSGRVELMEDLVIDGGDSFEAAEGTEFFLGPGVSIVSSTRLRLQDVKVRRLVADRPWGVIALQGAGASGSLLEDCDVAGGSEDTLRYIYYSGMLSVHLADGVIVRGCTFSDNVLGDDTLRFADSRELRIERVRVEGANGDAIDFDLSSGVLRDVVIDRARNDGIDLMTSVVDIERLTVRHAGDKGLSFGEASHSTVTDVSIEGSTTGVALKDASDPLLRDVTVRGCGVAIDGFDKNWRYPGGGRGRFVDCRLLDNEVDVRLDAVSELILEDCVTTGRFSLGEVGDRGRLRVMPGGLNTP